MPCCQCATPIWQVTANAGFKDIWASRAYADFRTAARSLPENHELLAKCECYNCQLRPRNLAIHNFLNPVHRIQTGAEVHTFTWRDLVRKVRGQHGHRASLLGLAPQRTRHQIPRGAGPLDARALLSPRDPRQVERDAGIEPQEHQHRVFEQRIH
jgi:hypothetical protein